MTEHSPHAKILEEMKQAFQDCKFIGAKRHACLKGWKITIASVLQLAEELRNSHGVPKLLTRNLNQDSLENLFAIVRQQHDLSKKHKEELKQPQKADISTTTVPSSDSDIPELLENISLTDDNAIYYVSGYVSKKFLKLHACDECRKILLDKAKLLTGEHQLFTYFKQSDQLEPHQRLFDEVVNLATKSATKSDISNLDLKRLWKRKIFHLATIKWHAIQNNKLQPIKPRYEDWKAASQSNRQLEIALTRLRIGHTKLTHEHLITQAQPLICDKCQVTLTVLHLLIECEKYTPTGRKYHPNDQLINVLANDPIKIENLFHVLSETRLRKLL
ncbi:hypothetical protein ILUMI_23551 [Ignelater luminosus]|uniref:Uncharacterized protein n=1 Tax=Ignelater luminosus TaxID=2038154 RepID=A0A8K0CF37_IGNLU|nr:hypothetical protein ILUMI_23551 [Ignelater luminosus]